VSVLILSHPMPAQAYVRELAARGFGHPCHTSLAEADPASVRWLIAWRLGSGVVSRLPNLELIMCCAAGVDRLLAADDLPPDLPIARVVDDVQALGMAQYVVHAVLDHLRLAPLYRSQQARREWLRHSVPTATPAALVLGLGPIGRRVAAALLGLGFDVSGWSRTAHVLPGVRSHVGPTGLMEALAHAQVLVNALPLTAETRGILNRDTLSALPRGAFVVNVARGAHLVEPDLVELLRSGHLGGAALDVQQREPPAGDDPLWEAPNLTLTPHVAGQLTPAAVVEQFLVEVELRAAGLPPMNPVDPRRGY
jgi:phosphoglycerate dehydrogenase-like enzyme